MSYLIFYPWGEKIKQNQKMIVFQEMTIELKQAVWSHVDLFQWQMLILIVTPILTLTLILIFTLTIPWTKNPIITSTLILCCQR